MSADEWQKGCDNIPKLNPIEPVTPFPLEVATIVNKVWRQDGYSKENASVMRYYNGIDLLLNKLNQSTLLYYLSRLINNSSGLVQYTGGLAQYTGNAPTRKKQKRKQKPIIVSKQESAIGELIPTLGLLLYKCGYKKEDYMKNAAYLIGQLLKISDVLHKLYCEIKRGGEIPPRLAGNGLFVSAAEMPVQTLAQLGVRMNPYISWAQQYSGQTKEKSDDAAWRLKMHAAWHLKMYKEISSALRDVFPESISFSDYDKAQLFIGYLAALPEKNTDVNYKTCEENK